MSFFKTSVNIIFNAGTLIFSPEDDWFPGLTPPPQRHYRKPEEAFCLLRFSSPQEESLQLPCSTHWGPPSTLSSQRGSRALSGAGSSVRMLLSARAKQVAGCPRVGFPVDLGMQAYVIHWDAPLKKSLGYWAGVSGIGQTHGCNWDMKKPFNACSTVGNLTPSRNTWEESLSWRVNLEQVGLYVFLIDV